MAGRRVIEIITDLIKQFESDIEKCECVCMCVCVCVYVCVCVCSKERDGKEIVEE